MQYPSDMTEREWLLTVPFIPPAKTGGRHRTMDLREVVNALLYIASSGGAWRKLPFVHVAQASRSEKGARGLW